MNQTTTTTLNFRHSEDTKASVLLINEPAEVAHLFSLMMREYQYGGARVAINRENPDAPFGVAIFPTYQITLWVE